MLRQFEVPFTYSLVKIARDMLGLKPAYPSDILLFLAAAGNILLRSLQIVGMVYFLKNREWHLDGAILLVVALGLVGTGLLLGNPRYSVPTEPFSVILGIAGADFLIRMFRKRVGPLHSEP